MTGTVSQTATKDATGWRLTGRHVLALLIGFFGIIIATSIIFTTLAVQSFRGEDVKRSYRQGLNYNDTIVQRAEQARLGWNASINIVGDKSDRRLLVKLSSAGDDLAGLTITGRLRHPVDTALDRPLTFDVQNDGIARADISDLLGQWTVEAEAIRGEDRFAFRRDIDLR